MVRLRLRVFIGNRNRHSKAVLCVCVCVCACVRACVHVWREREFVGLMFLFKCQSHHMEEWTW